MRKLLKFIMLYVLTFSITMAMIACSSDGDDNKPTQSGIKYSSIVKTYVSTAYTIKDRFTFQYNSDGQLAWIDEDGNTLYFKYNPFSMYDAEAHFYGNLNKNGYLVSGYDEEGSEYSISYDSDGYIKSFVFEYEGGDEFSYTFTWKNGLLTTIKSVEEESPYITETTIVITYGNDKNVSGLWPLSFDVEDCVGFFDLDYDRTIAISGLLGKAPTKYPISFEFKSKYVGGGQSGEYSGIDKVEYTLNDDGTLNTEKLIYDGDYEMLQYHYTLDSRSADELVEQITASERPAQIPSCRRAFRKLRGKAQQ